MLEAQEIKQIRPFIEVAIGQARRSPCQKSKRGVVIFKDGNILGTGFNEPVNPNNCIPEICLSVCSLYTIHAERKALQNALASGHELTAASVLHIKLSQAFFVPEVGEVIRAEASDDLSCDDCSGYMQRLSQKMPLKEFILYQSRGYIAYGIEEFHNLTLAYLRVHP